ncbi:glucokinase [Klebsiella pneumoniae]|nr:glucokinase [Klebsiella pneumoniae]
MSQFCLVGDIGGTNARISIFDKVNHELVNPVIYSCNEYPFFDDVLRNYIENSVIPIDEACLAIACPILGDFIQMTNHTWGFSITEIKKKFNFQTLEVINDFTAIAYAIPFLGENDIIDVSNDNLCDNGPIVVFGPGTGLGVSHLVKQDDLLINIPGEGGHVDMPAVTVLEANIINHLREIYGRVSAERILSGQGIVNLYRAICHTLNETPVYDKAESITAYGVSNDCPICYKTLELFCTFMGRFGGNLALNFGAFGGVYIAGGIIPKILQFFLNSNFRFAFEDKGRFKTYLQSIPVFIIIHETPGLLGAGSYLLQHQKKLSSVTSKSI